MAAGDTAATAALEAAAAAHGPCLAVRSSAVGEDSDAASFAGQHLSLLNVPRAGLAAAVRAVVCSAGRAGALAYRERLGLEPAGTARVGVVVQAMVGAETAGVLFWPHPVTGADEVVVEAAWGLGEAVVAGLVTPDLFRLSATGEILERRPGNKDLRVGAVAGGGTAARPVPGARARALCLEDARLADLHRLATACRRVFGGSQDLEWALARGVVWLLQRRPVRSETRRSGTAR